jgi:dienelactone hydrolase
MSDFLHYTSPNPQAQKAIILIPDIWGLTDYTQATARAFASDYKMPCYILDYFYQLTKTPSRFDPKNDSETAVGLMNRYRGEDFIGIFNKAVAEVKSVQPNLIEIYVIGFCFGGRLAYLSGLEKSVNKIVSFYGAGAVKDGFYNNQSALSALSEARAKDTGLKVLSFYGTRDDSIPEVDRAATQRILDASQIIYAHHEFDTGHAYYQQGRPSYDQPAATQSKAVLDKFILNKA